VEPLGIISILTGLLLWRQVIVGRANDIPTDAHDFAAAVFTGHTSAVAEIASRRGRNLAEVQASGDTTQAARIGSLTDVAPGKYALTRAEVATFARAAGFTTPDLNNTMVAIARAESGWNPKAHNPIPPDNSYGLWQINMIGAMGPQRRKQFGITSNDQLFAPAINAHAAWLIYRQQGLKAWSTYSNGHYKKYLAPTETHSQN
jgi:hypothetical protein